MKLADTSSVKQCIETLQSLPKKVGVNPKTFVIRANSLFGLNYLLIFSPEKIIFINKEENSLNYMHLIVELISICNSESEFISRVFSRPVEAFIEKGETLFPFSRLLVQREMFQGPAEGLMKGLNEFTQWSYLAEPYDTNFLEETLSKLSTEGKKRFEQYLGPYQKGHVRFDEDSCRRLLPCWSFNDQPPFSESERMANNLYGELEPSTNTFYYGNLWLTKKETFQAIKQKLAQAEIQYTQIDPFSETIVPLCDFDDATGFYVCDVPHKKYFTWKLQLEKTKEAYQNHTGILFAITQSGDIEKIDSQTPPQMKHDRPALPFKSLQDALDHLNYDIEEGHIEERKMEYFEKYLKNSPQIKKVLEVGFNAGHSAEFFLQSRDDIEVLSFDLMDHDYTLVGKNYIDAAFSGRHQLIGGDSKKTVPQYHQKHPGERYDLIFIDGGHMEECAAADIANLKHLAHKDTLVIIDDIEQYEDGALAWWSEGPTKAWNKAIQKGVIEEISRESFVTDGWATGRYKL